MLLNGKTTIFGDYVTYYNKYKISNKLTDLIYEGFEDFSSEGITSFLTFRYPIWKYTMFKNVYRIPFGCEYKNNFLIEEWEPKFSSSNLSIEKSIIKIENILKESIKNLVKDHKIAIPLSGGLDSSLIAALIRNIYPKIEINTYSAGFYGDDEFEYSRKVSKYLNTNHKEVVLNKEDYIGEFSLLKPLIKFKGEPLHPNEIALAYIENIAKKDGCTLAICGEGSDDIFGGYGQNLRMYLNYKKEKPFFEYFMDNYRYFSLEDRYNLINDKYLVSDIDLINKIIDKKNLPKDIRDQALYFIQKFHTPGLITRGVNAMSFNSLEIGFPYINKKLVKFVNSLPFNYKVHWKEDNLEEQAKNLNYKDVSENLDIPKYILKLIAEKYLPKDIIYRKKKGFPVPFDLWFKDLKEWDLDQDLFKTNDISFLSGWKKFMIINLNTFINEFKNYKIK